MSNVETNLIKPFPVAFSGHTLKYEIECICKIFLPMRKFTFLYDTTQLPADAEEGAVLILEQLGEQERGHPSGQKDRHRLYGHHHGGQLEPLVAAQFVREAAEQE